MSRLIVCTCVRSLLGKAPTDSTGYGAGTPVSTFDKQGSLSRVKSDARPINIYYVNLFVLMAKDLRDDCTVLGHSDIYCSLEFVAIVSK